MGVSSGFRLTQVFEIQMEGRAWKSTVREVHVEGMGMC
jgi:hypothetical protein